MRVIICPNCGKRISGKVKKCIHCSSHIQKQYEKSENYKQLKIGEIIKFGSYYQNKDGKIKTPIEWEVLEVKDGKTLIVSKYGLDTKPYNKDYMYVTWESCTLRKWLNNDFFNTAFSEEEQSKIQSAIVSSDKNPKYFTDSGKITNDKVFLLSIKEAKKYYSDKKMRKCEPTKYAKSKRVLTNDGTCWWWLRSSGDYYDSAAIVASDGSIYYSGLYIHDYLNCVRPVLWIML